MWSFTGIHELPPGAEGGSGLTASDNYGTPGFLPESDNIGGARLGGSDNPGSNRDFVIGRKNGAPGLARRDDRDTVRWIGHLFLRGLNKGTQGFRL